MILDMLCFLLPWMGLQAVAWDGAPAGPAVTIYRESLFFKPDSGKNGHFDAPRSVPGRDTEGREGSFREGGPLRRKTAETTGFEKKAKIFEEST